MNNAKASQDPEPISRLKEKYFPKPFVERQLLVCFVVFHFNIMYRKVAFCAVVSLLV